MPLIALGNSLKPAKFAIASYLLFLGTLSRQLMKQIFLLSLIIFSCGTKRLQETPLFIDLSSDIVSLKHYIITKNNEKIIIDGLANEASWQLALFSDSFIDIEGVEIPKYDTKMKLLWDENYLYVFAQMEEPHIWGDLTLRDTIIFYNNDFEVFISPSGTTRNYGEIEINASGTVWDLLLDRPYRDKGKAINHWNLDSLKSAIHIEGSINNHSDIDSFWTVETAIPMKALMELKNKKQPLLLEEGEQWRINFSRVEWDYDIVGEVYQRKKEKNNKLQREYNWVWSNQNVINMHEPEKWGIIQFTTEVSSENITFIKDENREIKQVAYALFRQTKWGNLKALLNEKVSSIRVINVKFSDENYLNTTFYKTNFGFEYKINIPQSDKAFIINESGILKKG